MRRNKGMSLVELLIAVAILSVVLVIAVSFMITGSRSFTKGNADSLVQREAELTVNQIADMIIDINGGVSKTDIDADKTQELVMYHTEKEGGTVQNVKETVTWDETSQNLQCRKCEVTYDASSGTWTDGSQIYPDELLAEHVTSFYVDIDDVIPTLQPDGTTKDIVKSVLVQVGYDDGTGIVDYATSPVITLRNRMLLSDDPGNIFDERTPMSETMKLFYSGTEFVGIVPIVDRVSEVNRGAAYNIYARIDSGSDVNDLVDWKIEETGTLSTIDATGYLTVGAYEANDYLTITASYKSNPNKKATGVVKVMGAAPLKSFKSVHIFTDSLKPYVPQFSAFPVTENFTQAEEDAITYQWTVRLDGSNWGGRKLSDVVEPFAENGKKLALTIKKESENFGKILEITVEAYSDVTGERRTDRIKYRIDNNENAGGDSSMERAKMEYDTTDFTMTDQSHGADDFKFAYCFCDESGNPISSFCDSDGNILTKWHDYPESSGTSVYDQYLKDLQVTPLGEWGVSYRLAFKDSLPRTQEYYVMVQCCYKGSGANGLEQVWYRERIHYIPAVQLYGKTYYHAKINAYQDFEFDYRMVGFYGKYWVDHQAYEYKIENIDCEGLPVGAKVDADIIQTSVKNLENNIMKAQGHWRYDPESIRGDWAVMGQIEFKSVSIRVSVKDEPSINALVTVIFE